MDDEPPAPASATDDSIQRATGELETPYECQFCGECFAHNQELFIHRRTVHTGTSRLAPISKLSPMTSARSRPRNAVPSTSGPFVSLPMASPAVQMMQTGATPMARTVQTTLPTTISQTTQMPQVTPISQTTQMPQATPISQTTQMANHPWGACTGSAHTPLIGASPLPAPMSAAAAVQQQMGSYLQQLASAAGGGPVAATTMSPHIQSMPLNYNLFASPTMLYQNAYRYHAAASAATQAPASSIAPWPWPAPLSHQPAHSWSQLRHPRSKVPVRKPAASGSSKTTPQSAPTTCTALDAAAAANARLQLQLRHQYEQSSGLEDRQAPAAPRGEEQQSKPTCSSPAK